MTLGDTHALRADVLVIGAGAAGCRAAIEAADSGARVLLLVKGRFTHCGSSFYPLTHGLGFTTAIPGGPDEAAGVAAHYAEIMAAGQGMTSPTLARILAEDAPRRFEELTGKLELEFYRGPAGDVLYITPDYGSGAVRAGGATIAALQRAFARQIGRRDIQIVEDAAAVRLLGDAAGCRGAVAVTRDGELLVIEAGATILAAGGYAGLFEHHMTGPGLLGAGPALALALGAELVNLEYYQMILGITHPMRRMLIAESILGSLPRLTNSLGEEFLARDLPAGLSTAACMTVRSHTGPFHIGTPAMHFDLALFGEMRAGRALPGGGLRCDFTAKRADELQGFCDDWVEWALERGVDIRETPLEIAPQVHADNGGVLIGPDAGCRVPGLYAAGEAAGGAHGANRIGGNMMTNTQVFGARAGAAAAAWARGAPRSALPADVAAPERARLVEMSRRPDGADPRQALSRLQHSLYYDMAVQKNATTLAHALATLAEIEADDLPALGAPAGSAQLALELPQAMEMARLIVRSALLREESRGPHYRDDFPTRDDANFGRPLVWRKAPDAPPAARFEALP